jgi:hypothetical protein
MQTKETLKNVIIVLDKEEDFSKKSIEDLFQKIKEYKKLPFHDVILKMHSKYYVKFWEILISKKEKFKEAEIKNDLFRISF